MSALALRHRCRKVAEDDAFSQRLAGCGVSVMVMCCYKFAPTPGHGDPCAARYHQTYARFAQRALEAEGFISDHAARSKGKETPINLLVSKTAPPIPIARMIS